MLKKTFPVLFLKVFGAITGVLLTLVVTNSVDEYNAGWFFLYVSLIAFLGSILTLGSPVLIVRNVSKYFSLNKWELINNDVSLLLKTVLIIYMFILVVGSVYIYVFKRDYFIIFTVLWTGVFFFSIVQCISVGFQSLGRSLVSVLFQNILIPMMFISLLLIGDCFFEINDLLMLVLYSLSIITTAILCLSTWYKNKNAKFSVHSFLRMENKKSFVDVFTITIMLQVVQWSSPLIVGILMPPEDLAVYSSAQRVSLLASFVMVAVNIIVVPKLSIAFSSNNNKLNGLVKKASATNVLLGTPLLIVVLCFSSEIMSLFGSSYVSGANILIIMSIGQFINLVTGPVADLLYMTKNEAYMRNVVIITGLLSIILSIILTHYFGMSGAAYATALTVTIQNLLASYYASKCCGFNTLNIFRKV